MCGTLMWICFQTVYFLFQKWQFVFVCFHSKFDVSNHYTYVDFKADLDSTLLSVRLVVAYSEEKLKFPEKKVLPLLRPHFIPFLSVSTSPWISCWHTQLRLLNLVAPKEVWGILWRYPVLGSQPIHFLRRRWVHSLTVLNYAEGLRRCKDCGVIQRWIGLWSEVVIEFGSRYTSEWRMGWGERFSLFSPYKTKYMHYWRDCVHIKSLSSQRSSHVGVY